MDYRNYKLCKHKKSMYFPAFSQKIFTHHAVQRVQNGVSLDIENYCTLRLFFDLPTLAGLNRRNLPEAGIRLLFQI